MISRTRWGSRLRGAKRAASRVIFCPAPGWQSSAAGCLVFALCGGVCVGARAPEPLDGLQVHGFLTQGYFLTSSNRVFGHSEGDGSLDFIEAGINASWTPLPRLQLAVQPLFRRAGAGHDSDFEPDFGLIDYALFSTADRQLGLRLGRIKNPLGLYNDTRDVAFTRPSILLPESIYLDSARELFVSSDGAHGVWRAAQPMGRLLPGVWARFFSGQTIRS